MFISVIHYSCLEVMENVSKLSYSVLRIWFFSWGMNILQDLKLFRNFEMPIGSELRRIDAAPETFQVSSSSLDGSTEGYLLEAWRVSVNLFIMVYTVILEDAKMMKMG